MLVEAPPGSGIAGKAAPLAENMPTLTSRETGCLLHRLAKAREAG
jgi:hypothetical protein